MLVARLYIDRATFPGPLTFAEVYSEAGQVTVIFVPNATEAETKRLAVRHQARFIGVIEL